MSAVVDGAAAREQIAGFILENFLFGNETAAPEPDQSLLASRIIDSTGVLELIEFLESAFGIEVDAAETTPANLDSLNRISDYVVRKTSN